MESPVKGYCRSCKNVVDISLDGFSGERICSTCGTRIEEKNLESGTVISGFKILGEIESGPQWTVYRSFQLNLERQAALKVLSRKPSEDPIFVGRFFSKARVAASLNHPGIIQIYDAGITNDGIYYLASELIAEETLASKISRDGQMTIQSALKLALCIAKALNYAWEKQSLAHGELKPENIIMSSPTAARIADFGLLEYLTPEDRMAGTQGPFTAPELRGATNTSFNSSSDIYSFGALLYFMLSGKPPLMENIRPVESFNKEIKQPLASFTAKLLSVESASRPTSWDEVTSTLASIISGREKAKSHGIRSTNSSTGTVPRNLIPMPAPPEHQASPTSPAKKKKTSFILGGTITALLAAVIVLATLIFHLLDASSKLNADPVTLQKWQSVKENIQFLDIDAAINMIRDFISETGSRSPKEAIEMLKEMKKKGLRSRQEKDSREDFTARLASMESTLKKIVAEKEASQKLENIRKEIQKLKTDSKKYSIPEIIFTAQSKRSLEENLKKITAVLYARSTKKLVAPKAPRTAAKPPAPVPKKTPPPAPNPGERLRTNQMIDEYYVMLNAALTAPDDSTPADSFKESLTSWRKKYGAKTNSVWGRKANLFGEILASSGPANTFLQNLQELLKGKTLPIKEYPEGYLVDSVDQDQIKLVLNDGKALLGKKIRTTVLSNDELAAIVATTLQPKKETESFTKGQLSSMLLFFARAGKFPDMKTLTPPNPWNKDMKLFRELMSDIESARLEAEAAVQWKIISEALKKKDPYSISNALLIISSRCAATSFLRRYAPEIKNYATRYNRLTPDILASMFFAEHAAIQPEEINLAPEKLFPLLTAFNRFGLMETGSPELKTKIESLKRSFSMLPGLQKEFTDNDKCLPFMDWEKAVPGEVRAYRNFLMGKNTLRKEDSVFKLFSMGAALDSFNWKTVNALYEKDLNYPALFGESFKNRKWAPYLTFSAAFVSGKLGDGQSAQKYLDYLTEIEISFTDGETKTAACILLMEYAVMSGVPEAAIKTAEKFDFKNSSEVEDVKIRLLNIYAMLESPKTDVQTIEKTINEFLSEYSDKNDFKGDTAWCASALKIVKGCSEQDRKWLVNNLKPFQCYASDICARILACAYARSRYESSSIYSDRLFASEIAEFIDSKVTDTTASSELWEKATLLKLANAANLSELEAVMKKRFADYRPASIMSYSFLCFLYAGIEALKNKAPGDSVNNLLLDFFRASPAASESDVKAASIAISKSPRGLLFELMSDSNSHGAFNASILGVMLFQGEERMDIYATISELEKNISFEKKLLLKNLSKYIK